MSEEKNNKKRVNWKRILVITLASALVLSVTINIVTIRTECMLLDNMKTSFHVQTMLSSVNAAHHGAYPVIESEDTLGTQVTWTPYHAVDDDVEKLKQQEKIIVQKLLDAGVLNVEIDGQNFADYIQDPIER